MRHLTIALIVTAVVAASAGPAGADAGLRIALIGAEIAIWTRMTPAFEPAAIELEADHAAGVV
jgi:hypothetical protein